MKVNISRRIHYLFGPIIGPSGPGVWTKAKEENWQNFRSELFEIFSSKDMIDESVLIVHTELSYVIEISFLEHKEKEVKAIIQKVAQRHKVEIEFEEEKKKEEKWIPIHEIFLKNPRSSTADNVPTFAFLYAEKAKAPKEAIPKLLKFFKEELKDREVIRSYGTFTYEHIEKAIKNLEEQQEEG